MLTGPSTNLIRTNSAIHDHELEFLERNKEVKPFCTNNETLQEEYLD
jgi:hypothetical protein